MATKPDVEVTILDETTPRPRLIEALLRVNHEAATTHPSPRWDRQHEFIDQLLEWIVGR
jgi:hypothetical protein